MCGITGFIDYSENRTEETLNNILLSMTDTLAHRGPDDSGTWIDTPSGVCLGHRRLSIIDLSPAGSQPMISADKRYVIICNGEIYNFTELKKELEQEGYPFKGRSDTEVLLASIQVYGLEKSLKKTVGMFAFALFDRDEKVLYLARDRMGEKPLYYGWAGSSFLFSSELKALRKHPQFSSDIDRNALSLFLQLSYIPSPHCIYSGIRKLIPGQWLKIHTYPDKKNIETHKYWSVEDAASEGLKYPFTDSQEAADELERLLFRSVKMQMVSDVPIGAFLSGGIDSSTIAAVSQACSRSKINTFTAGFYEKSHNEAEYAKQVANHLGTNHYEMYVSSSDAIDVIEGLPAIYDEPFADPSQIPTCMISKLFRKHVTVALSGDGADELFGGYNRYIWGKNIRNLTGALPFSAKMLLKTMMMAVSTQGWDRLFKILSIFIPARLKVSHPGDKIHKLARTIDSRNLKDLYTKIISHIDASEKIAYHSDSYFHFDNIFNHINSPSDFIAFMQLADMCSYLPDDILVKVDRASMAASLESRAPFLDHRIVEFSWKLPLEMKLQQGKGKWLLRQVLKRYVPDNLIERPKTGFGVPVDLWLKGPLYNWAEELLQPEKLNRDGFFCPEPILTKWQEHISGKRNWQYFLWNVLMFQAWIK